MTLDIDRNLDLVDKLGVKSSSNREKGQYDGFQSAMLQESAPSDFPTQ